jgi:hypothetical protein
MFWYLKQTLDFYEVLVCTCYSIFRASSFFVYPKPISHIKLYKIDHLCIFKGIRNCGWLNIRHYYYDVRTCPQNAFPKFHSKSISDLFSRLSYLRAVNGISTPKKLHAIFDLSVPHVQLIINILIKYFMLMFVERRYLKIRVFWEEIYVLTFRKRSLLLSSENIW